MTSPKKPEWLELSESDERSAAKRASKRLRILTLTASLLVIGVGAVTAQASNPSSTSADDGIINVEIVSPLSTDSDSTDSDSTDSNSTDSNSTDSDSDEDSDEDSDDEDSDDEDSDDEDDE